MNYWILKTEPSTYSFDDLLRDQKTTWDGVKNPFALNNLRAMRVGDPVLIYHSNVGKCVVGLAEVVTEAYPDPKKKDKRLVVVDIKAKRKLKREVTLAEIKAHSSMADLKLVRVPRLSVIPVPEKHWKTILQMAGEESSR